MRVPPDGDRRRYLRSGAGPRGRYRRQPDGQAPDDWAKGIILCITVEFYAILSLLASFLMLLNLHLGA